MRDWFQIVLLSLSESFLWSSVVFFACICLDLSVLWGHAFAVVFGAYLLGQLVALATEAYTKNSESHSRISRSGSSEVTVSGNAKARLLLYWGAVIFAIGILIWAVSRYGGCHLSWTYAQIVFSVFASALGINSVTKHLDAAKAMRNMVFGTLLLFAIGLFPYVPQKVILGNTACYLAISSIFIVRQRGFEVDYEVSERKNKLWNASSVILVCVAGFVALGLVALLTGGKQLLGDLYQFMEPALEKGLDLIILPVAYLLEWISNILSKFIDPNNADFAVEFQPFFDQTKEMNEQDEVVSLLPPWAKWLLIGLAIVAGLIFLWRFISKTEDRPETKSDAESRTSVFSPNAFKEWLDLTLSQGREELSKKLREIGRLILRPEPKTIEDLYLATTEYTSRRIIAKDPSQTPFEYAKAIEANSNSPDTADLVHTISLIFSECHYSEIPPNPIQWATALTAYRTLTRD